MIQRTPVEQATVDLIDVLNGVIRRDPNSGLWHQMIKTENDKAVFQTIPGALDRLKAAWWAQGDMVVKSRED